MGFYQEPLHPQSLGAGGRSITNSRKDFGATSGRVKPWRKRLEGGTENQKPTFPPCLSVSFPVYFRLEEITAQVGRIMLSGGGGGEEVHLLKLTNIGVEAVWWP